MANNFLKFNPPASILNTKNIISHLESIDAEIDLSKTIQQLIDKSCKFKGFDNVSDRVNALKKKYTATQQESPSKPLQTSFEATDTNTNTNTNTNTKLKDLCRADAQPDADELTGELILSDENTEPAILDRDLKPDTTDPIREVFEFWQATMGHLNAKLDEKRRKLIRNAIKTGYPINDLKTAILGCSLTPHNVGDNDRGQRYDGLHVIFKDADQIDRFIHNAINRESMDANRENHQRGQSGLSIFDNDITGTPDELWNKICNGFE